MYSSTQKKEAELTPLVEAKPAVPRISRIPTGLFKESAAAAAGETSQQTRGLADTNPLPTVNESGGSNSVAPPGSRNTNNKAMKMLEDSHPRFGPMYRIEQPSVQATKDKAWEHVLKKSTKKELSSKEPTKKESSPKEEEELQELLGNEVQSSAAGDEASKEEVEVIKEMYSSAMRKVEQEAKKVYADKVYVTGSAFRWMMIKDGCFFLQSAILTLGGSEKLGYPSNDPIFGQRQNKKDFKKWIEAMFYVGNQIPLIVLKQLMKQTFFQNVVKKGGWNIVRPSSLCKQVLYDVLFNQQQPPPSDLLHALQNMVLGPAPQGHLYESDGQIDLEGGNEDGEIDGQDGLILPSQTNSADDEVLGRIRVLLNAVGLGGVVEDRTRTFPCAADLKQSGIRIRKLKSGGARSIHFKSYYFWANLYLPVFSVDEHTEVVLRNLKTYEITSQQVGRNRREVASYLKIMSDIVQTRNDARMLKDKGVVCVSSLDHVEKLPEILSRLSSGGDMSSLTPEFRMLRQQISNYSSPLVHYKGVLNLVVALTVFQSILALLAYLLPRN